MGTGWAPGGHAGGHRVGTGGTGGQAAFRSPPLPPAASWGGASYQSLVEPTTQLNVRIRAALADKLRKAAVERHTLPGALVAQALEQFLAADSGAAPALSADSSKWEERLAAVEQQLVYLQGRLKTPLSRPAAPPPAAVPSPPPPAPKPIPQSGEALTTAQVAEQLGMKRGSFNERIRRAGGAVEGLEMEGWRIVGQAKPPQGGPAQWLWEPI